MKRDHETRLKGARWSATSRCPRQGAYSALGAIPSPSSEAVRGMQERGHDLEDVYERRLKERYSGPYEREQAIPWGEPGWELHVDFMLPELDRQHLEVKSTTKIDTIPGALLNVGGVERKAPIWQVAGAAVFDPEGGTAQIAVMSPTTYQHHEFDVVIDADLEAAVHELEQLVVRAVTTGELPDRVCTVPSDATARFCPYRDTCFSDWEPVEQVVTTGAVVVLAHQLRQAEDAVRQANGDLSVMKERRDDLRRQMRDYTTAGLEYEIGGVRIRRTVSTRGRRTFKLSDALSTGALPAEDIDGPLSRLGNFITESAPTERWTVGDPVSEADDA